MFTGSEFSEQTTFGSSLANETFSVKTESVAEEDKSVQSTCWSSTAQTEVHSQETLVHKDKVAGNITDIDLHHFLSFCRPRL